MPGASKSKHSKQGRERRERYGARKVGIRSTLPIVAIVCDDTHAAPIYFGELKRQVKQHVTVDVVPAPCQGAMPALLLERAAAKKQALAEARDDSDRDVVWILIDLEAEAGRRVQAQATKDNAEASGVKVALSDPCYEVWTLLHFEDSGAQFDDCSAVVARIKQLWKARFRQDFEKSQADYAKIIDRRHEAADRAQAHWKRGDPSRTEVFRVVQVIDGYKSGSDRPVT